MLTGYSRSISARSSFYVPQEPDANHLRVQICFDSACDLLPDYSRQNNEANIGFTDTLPILLKGTAIDDGITTGDFASISDGRTIYYYIPVTDKNSIKSMAAAGKAGVTFLFRHFPLFIRNEAVSSSTQRATLLYYLENDQVEYAAKVEISDTGQIYFFFKYQETVYNIVTTSPLITVLPSADYTAADYATGDYDTVEEQYSLTYPIPYIDLAFEFNFVTKAISILKDGVTVQTTATGIVLVPPAPAPIFPLPFDDPPPPPPDPVPIDLPFTKIYDQIAETSNAKINAVTVTEQDGFYNIPPGVSSIDRVELIYNVPEGKEPETPPPPPPGGGGTFDGTLESSYDLLGEIQSSDNSSVVLSSSDNDAAGTELVDSSTGIGAAIVGKIVHRFTYYANSDGSATGELNGKMWDADGNEIFVYGPAGFDASDIAEGNEYNPYHFAWWPVPADPREPPAMQEGYRIGVEYLDPDGTIEIQRTSAQEDESLCQASRDEGADETDWKTNTDHNVRMQFWTIKPEFLPALRGGQSQMQKLKSASTQPIGKRGATAPNGVISAYGTGEYIESYVQDFKAGSHRWDFEGLGSSRFAWGEELTAYLRTDTPNEDEITGIMGGGTHGDLPKCYNVGIDTITGETRYRMEEEHPDPITGEDGGTGVGLQPVYVGFRFIKWNQPNGVRLEIWQDRGNNEGTTPANDWQLVSSWTETEYNWQTPPSDHQVSLRTDGDDDALDSIEVKWLGLREILTTDTEGGTGPVTPPSGVGVHEEISNNPNAVCAAGEVFQPGSPLIGSIPTTMEFMVWRSAEATTGTVNLIHYDSTMAVKAVYINQSVVSLPTEKPFAFNFVWQDTENIVPILDTDRIVVEVVGLAEGTGVVYVMTDEGNAGTPEIPPTPGGTFVPPIIAAPPSYAMKDYGGVKFSRGVTVHFIFWGDDWEDRDSPYSMANVHGAMQIVFDSKYFDTLYQYGGIGRPKLGTFVINKTYPADDNFDEDAAMYVVDDCIQRDLVPYSSEIGVHMYYVLPAHNIDPDNDWWGDWWGIHSYFNYSPTEAVAYQLAPYTDLLEEMTKVLIHEIVETITDAFPSMESRGIYANDAGPFDIDADVGAEICDVCNDLEHEGEIGGIGVVSYWSNQDNACVIPTSDPSWVSCPEGATWDPVLQTCVSTAKAGTPGNPGNDFDGTRTCFVTKSMGSSSMSIDRPDLDIAGRISRGGGMFTGYIELNDRRKRTGIKVNMVGSAFVNRTVTKVDTIMKAVIGSGTDLPLGPVSCVIRDQTGALKATIGAVDSSMILEGTDTPITFTNTENNYRMVLSDTLSVEYYLGTSLNYILVSIDNGFFNSAEASKTMLFESIVSNINYASTLYKRDLAAVVYTGGKPDLLARPMRGVKVNTINSVLFDEVVSEVRLKLKGTGTLPLGNILRVKIIRGSDKKTQIIIGQLDINSIDTTFFLEYYFRNPSNTYRMKVGDMVAVEFNHGNSLDAFLETKQSNTNFYDGNDTVMFEYNGSVFTDVVDHDLAGNMSIGGYTIYPDPALPVPIPPFHHAHGYYINAAAPDDSNAEADPYTLPPKTNSFCNNISKELRVYDTLLTENQLTYYYNNRHTITPLQKGHIAVVGHAYL